MSKIEPTVALRKIKTLFLKQTYTVNQCIKRLDVMQHICETNTYYKKKQEKR